MASRRRKAENLKIRSELMIAIRGIIEERGLKQTEAAGSSVPPSRASATVVRGKIDEFTIDSLVNMLAKAGGTW